MAFSQMEKGVFPPAIGANGKILATEFCNIQTAGLIGIEE
jgi:hypothetical protein